MVVGEGLKGVAAAQMDDLAVRVDAEHLGPAELSAGRPPAAAPRHCAGLDRAGRDLGQHRREQQVVARLTRVTSSQGVQGRSCSKRLRR